jgi:hypothetical protein
LLERVISFIFKMKSNVLAHVKIWGKCLWTVSSVLKVRLIRNFQMVKFF